MTIEQARVVPHLKPWGLADLRPWSSAGDGVGRIGELSYERTNPMAPVTALLLKLLFTSEPLSIQVHPDDDAARAMGLPNGKSEAWYVLAAAMGAKVALGLIAPLTNDQLRRSIADGSIASQVDWKTVKPDDLIEVPAGTIHAIGAGVVIAEVQQRSDATFRLFDHGRSRALHIDDALAVSVRTPPDLQLPPERLSAERTLLAANRHFVLERLTLSSGSAWCLMAERETWLIVLDGSAQAGSNGLVVGDGIFAQCDQVDLTAGRTGLECLVAYTGAGGPVQALLQRYPSQAPAGASQPGECIFSGSQIGVAP